LTLKAEITLKTRHTDTEKEQNDYYEDDSTKTEEDEEIRTSL